MKESKIILPSRYEDVNTVFYPIDDKKGYITSNGEYVRVGLNDTEDKLSFVDFEGGPMIKVGELFKNKKVKNIRTAYLVEFE